MATASKLVKIAPAIEPELKALIDEVLVPILVKGALSEIRAEKTLAPNSEPMAHSLPITALHSAEENA